VSAAGSRELSRFEKIWFDFKALLRSGLTSTIVIKDGAYETAFVCENRKQAHRAMSLWVKEAGTMAWIESHVRPGDCFLDIGANVGIYTLAAAHRAGAAGRVYAIEPHKPNAVALMRNVLSNNFQDRVVVLAMPVADRRMVATFQYRDLGAASTGSQLNSTKLNGKEFQPLASELCIGLPVDELVATEAIRAPHVVKIDVDGIELDILKGMQGLLTSAERPRSVQVELNVGEQDAIIDYMASQKYRLESRHFTLDGKRQLAAGKDVAKIAHNAIFAPV